MAVKTSEKNVKYKSVTQMVNKLASPKFKKDWRELQKAKKVKEVKAWGLKDQFGYLFCEAHFYRKGAVERANFIYAHTCQLKPKVIRVSIKEIK